MAVKRNQLAKEPRAGGSLHVFDLHEEGLKHQGYDTFWLDSKLCS